ncbi:TetR/AcrR family transcriptional regulator [Micromonospora sp. NBC_01796]|uniref:TetR/AcrR family transcriptional regulator n=1 Tax=Micromonospora sp. NBC_01796 TaxID=2975987 RepID=UPI002DD88D63|nr:helix-turn-helix domain-containing protein [Micromonospora sp. NBC_01796]WSA87288.1 TetR/AcrR family transcriptional regulator [Micromonospora sp. NBC_01796]
MTASPTRETVAAEGTRARLLDTALALFCHRGFAGTSLQMIADQLGITKAAVYHHFKTRDEILASVIRPAVEDMAAVIADASAQRTPTARAERMLVGWVDLAIRHRSLIALLQVDPGVKPLLKDQENASILLEQPCDLLAGHLHGTVGAGISAQVALFGIAAAAAKSEVRDLDDDELREILLDVGRRILGLRRPRTA